MPLRKVEETAAPFPLSKAEEVAIPFPLRDVKQVLILLALRKVEEAAIPSSFCNSFSIRINAGCDHSLPLRKEEEVVVIP